VRLCGPAGWRPPSVHGPFERDAGEASIVCGVDGSEHAVAAARLAGELAAQIGLRLLVDHALRDVK
jgi:hypothetical protein